MAIVVPQKCAKNHDGKIYKMPKQQGRYNYPPLHPFCRSTVRGYIGKNYVPNMSYKEWIKNVRFNPNVRPEDVPIIMP